MIRTVAPLPAPQRRRVRVWFGEHVIFDYVGTPIAAERYEQAMRRRFAGLRVTNDAADSLAESAKASAERRTGGGLW